MAVLRMQPVSTRFDLRHTLGPQYVDNFWSFALDTDLDQAWWNAQQQIGVLQFPQFSLPLPPVTPQSAAVFAPWTVGMPTRWSAPRPTI